MEKKAMSKEYIKTKGVHYTPNELSFYMAELLVDQYLSSHTAEGTLKIMDPACGDGELLVAISYILREKNILFEIYGVDTNKEELDVAKKRLKELDIKLHAFKCDYIKNYKNFLDFDMVIANPPYVRTQNIDSKTIDVGEFSLGGRFDLYQVFFSAITQSLKDTGVICIITSNKFMFNKAGEKTRKFLKDNYLIDFIIDLGDTKLFKASVLPAIFLGEKMAVRDEKNIKAVRVYETGEEVNSKETLFDAIKKQTDSVIKYNGHNYSIECGTIGFVDNKSPWAIIPSNKASWVNKIVNKKYCVLGDWANVKVGIKTTADKVFIKKDISDFKKIEPELIHEMIFSKNSSKWFKNDDKQRFILYPYVVTDGKQSVIDLEDYSSADAYFKKNRKVLKSRKYFKNSKKQWYEIWVSHSLDEFRREKIVVPDISSEPRFLYDDKGLLVDGNCYWIVLKEHVPKDHIFLILGLCNSKFMEEYHDLIFQNKLYSGKRRYVSQYINNYPMIDPNSKEARKIISAVKNIVIKNKDILEQEAIIEESIDKYWREKHE